MGKIKKLELTPKQYAQLENGFRNGESHCFRMRCRAVLLKGKGLSSVKAGEQTEMSFIGESLSNIPLHIFNKYVTLDNKPVLKLSFRTGLLYYWGAGNFSVLRIYPNGFPYGNPIPDPDNAGGGNNEDSFVSIFGYCMFYHTSCTAFFLWKNRK
ncbi:MAG: hypothetical protein ACTTH7_04895 [Treponema sp.]